jgi:laminin alpha 1/2
MLTFALNHKDRDSLLFYLPATKKHGNDQETDFLAVEMLDRQIRFLWNAGGGTTVLSHPLKLQPSPDDLSDDSRWYKIEAERTGNVGSLRVRPVKPENDRDIEGVTVTGAGPARFTKIDLTTGDKLYIGRVPDNAPTDLKTSKFSGHLHQLWYDGQPVGLWNFMSTSAAGCSPSMEGAQEAKDESSFRFNGQGYAELAQIPRYDSRQYSITFSFKSLDENALLFLAINETHLGQYISLELTEGLIRYQVRYGSGYEMSLQSRQKYNTGQWVKVEASRVLIRGVETALLKVADDEELSAAPFNFGVPDLELEEAKLYVGGLPPDVSISPDLMGSVPGSFLGCMKDLQVVAFGMNPLQGSFYGVEASCGSQTINKIVAFAGTGYIQLRAARPTGRDMNFGLSFKTEMPEGILFFSAPIPAVSFSFIFQFF